MPIIMRETLEKRIEKVLREAVELADLGNQRISARKIADRVFDTEPDLVEEAKRPILVDRWAWLIARMRRARWDAESRPYSQQMVLDDPIFKDLPKTVFLRNGKRPKLDFCLLTDTEDHLKLLRERFQRHPRVIQFEAVVELHRKWAAIKRGCTWYDAKQMEAEERDKALKK
jgi:hypothetical protein